jgi:Antibiotic biosynthesis monooxygenase
VNAESASLPDMTRADIDIIAISQWQSTCATDHLARVDELMDAWTMKPGDGLLSFTCLAGTTEVKDFGPRRDPDDSFKNGPATALRLMTYEQWATEEELRAFLEARPQRSPSVDALVATTDGTLQSSAEYRLYRSHRNAIADDMMATPRNIVVNTVDFDGPDEDRLRRWIDGVVDALEAEPDGIPGLICAHLHVSATGTRVLNFAEWTTEEAYDGALAKGPRGVGQTDLAEWQSVKDFSGVTSDTVNQYALHRSLAIPTAAASGS